MAEKNHYTFLKEEQEGCLVQVHVQPRASRAEVAGIQGDRLKIRLTAPPLEGEANKECVKFLAKIFKVSKSRVLLKRGNRSRQKTFLIRSVSLEELQKILDKRGLVSRKQ